jgi:4-amino-4-deoxy-L-arabinose transferase-like glycosyltransferase
MSTENNLTKTIHTSAHHQTFTALGLAAIILLGAFLRFYHLGAASIGNEYYAAAVKSMLTSWHDFFFVAFEPGGSVSVDKPPLGLWLETVSAYFLGLNGFALAFPNALAGVLSIPLLFSLVKKQFGPLAGLTAALALDVTPITIAAERNNTMDGMLVFFLLLAAWTVWRSVESGRFRFLLLGTLLIGLGFNIKMLQAYMVLPALYALYFLGAKHGWLKRLTHLGLATGLLLAVSLSWALIVDAVPAANRPFIGSSADNTVSELIIGHNGLRRLISSSSYASLQGAAASGNASNPSEVGTAGLLRLFSEPLAPQASWLLPPALLGCILVLVTLGRPRTLTEKHLALLLWADWLLPLVLYFSLTSGLWHTYYLIMLGPALAALVGATVWAFEQLFARQNRFGWGLLALFSGITLGFEIFVLSAFSAYFALTSILMVVFWLTGMALLKIRPQTWALGLVLFSLLVGPLLWSGLTTFNPLPEVDLPVAGPLPGRPSGVELSSTQQAVLDYLTANTSPEAYLAATLDSHGAAPFILATGRPLLTLGGYIGHDNVITLPQLQMLVADGKLRYILDNGNLSQKPEISAWVKSTCAVVTVPGATVSAQTISQSSGGPRDQKFTALYDCGG